MDNIDTIIEVLLIFMNKEVESQGHMISQVHFSFDEGQEDSESFLEMEPEISFEDLKRAINISKSRGYIKHMFLGSGKYSGLALTEEGQGLAISSIKAKTQKPVHDGASNITITTFNNSGAAQIGNNNSQNIENAFNSILDSINDSNAPENEKEEAKNKLKDFLKHPLVTAAVGSGVTAILAML